MVQTIAITGASSGLGEQLAYVYAKAGSQLVLNARNHTKLMQVATKCHQLGAAAVNVVVADLTQLAAVQAVAQKMWQQFGQIDILINNAGMGLMKPAVDFTLEEESKLFAVNTQALIIMARTIGKFMQQNHTGKIINVASLSGKVPTQKASVYAATKAAIIAYSDSLRLELAKSGVHVMCVNLGPMKTPFWTQKADNQSYLDDVSFFVVTPQKMALKIKHAAAKNKRELNLPKSLATLSLLAHLLPHVSDYLNSGILDRK